MPGAPGDGTPGIGVAATGVEGLCAPLMAGAMRNMKLARMLTRSAAPRRHRRSFENRYTRDLSDMIGGCEPRGMLLRSGTRVERVPPVAHAGQSPVRGPRFTPDATLTQIVASCSPTSRPL